MSPCNYSNRRLPGLDGLRGLAALFVFGVHFNQIVRLDAQWGPFDLATFLANGNHGVALFFILSGYLLSLPFWRSTVSGTPMPPTLPYMVRRAARILPAYYLALTFLIVAGNFRMIPGTLPDILLHYTFLFNFTEFSIFSFNPPFWTLAVEMQFYLLLPLLFLPAGRIGEKKQLGLIILLCLLSYGCHVLVSANVSRIIYWPFDQWRIWIRPHGSVISHSLLAHLPIFLMGVLAGRFRVKKEEENRPAAAAGRAPVTICGIALFGVVLLLSTDIPETITLPFGRYSFPVIPLIITAMVLNIPETTFAGYLPAGRFPAKLGKISYGIYIFHLPVLNLTDRYLAGMGVDMAEHWVLCGIAALFVTVILAAVSLVLIERPVLMFVKRCFPEE